MVKQDEKMPDLKLVLKDSPFEDALGCVEGVFASLKVETIYDLENTPRSLTCSFCGISTHKLIRWILDWMENPPEVKEEPMPEPDPVVAEEVSVEVPVEIAAKKPVKRTRKRTGGTSSPRKKE